MLPLWLPLLATARSSLPSPSKSAVATENGREPTSNSDVPIEAEEVGIVTSKNITFDAPPPGMGLITVTLAVLGFMMSVVRMFAINRERLTNLVARALPFHLTCEPGTNPVPFTVSVNPAPPGCLAQGTRGPLITGTEFPVPVARLSLSCSCVDNGTGSASAANNVIVLVHVKVLDFTVASYSHFLRRTRVLMGLPG